MIEQYSPAGSAFSPSYPDVDGNVVVIVPPCSASGTEHNHNVERPNTVRSSRCTHSHLSTFYIPPRPVPASR